MSLLPTLSGLDRVARCPASHVLPAAPRPDDPDATVGTARHEFIADVGDSEDPSAMLERVPAEHREVCAAIQFEGAPVGYPYEHEVAIAHDVVGQVTTRLGKRINRAYPATEPGEIVLFGSLDSLRVAADHVEVHDFKGEHDRTLPAADQSYQLRGGLYMLMALTGKDHGQARYWRVMDNGQIQPSPQTEMDAFSAIDFRQDLLAIADRVKRVRALPVITADDVTDGPWCRYCPALMNCPRQAETFAKLSAVEPLPVESRLMKLIQDRPEEALFAYRRAAALVKRFGDQLHAWASEHPISLGNGKWYGRSVSKSQDIDGEIMFSVISAAIGAEAAAGTLTKRGTKAAIERAARVLAGKTGKTITACQDELTEAVKAAGGWTEKTTTRLDEYSR